MPVYFANNFLDDTKAVLIHWKLREFLKHRVKNEADPVFSEGKNNFLNDVVTIGIKRKF